MLQLVLTLVAIFATSTLAQGDFETFRLPNNTRPETYDISIRTWVHQANTTFIGSVRIGIVAVESTDFITLHHEVRQLESVRVSSLDGAPVNIGELLYDEERSFLRIPIVGSNLTQGMRYFIDIDYVGSMSAEVGFYRYSYEMNDTRIWFGSTQFEPIYARKAFPCYDEPGLRTNFTIRITHVSTYTAVSNMPVVSETQNPDGSVTTEFETTPIMSTYLVAFHISDFPYVTSLTPGEIPQRIFARPTAINTTEVAVDAAEVLIDAFRDYIGIEYSLPKVDQIGVPGFPSGAMENWGLLMYDEYFFLFDKTSDYFPRKIEAVQTISHELAHNWFGNLVTPRWFDVLWMKEGFATFFEFLGIELVYPDWQHMDFFVTDVKQNVFYTDSNEFTNPMTFYVEHPLDIEQQYNSIAYGKAGSVLRMFWFMFGEETFMRGVRSYLQENSYSNTAEDELFEALDNSVRHDSGNIIPPNVDVPSIMQTWTRQAGFPLITVERNYSNETERVILRQRRYYTYEPENRANSTWWVPYNIATPRNPGFENTIVEGWIPQYSTSVELTVDSLGPDDYFLINKRAAGYYRTLYDERNYRLISDAILRNGSDFHSSDIAQLIDDALEFYATDQLPLTVVLDLLRVLEFESDFISWSPAFFAISYIDENFRGHSNYPIWIEFVRTLTEELYDSVGVEDIEDEPILRKYSRESIVELACRTGSVHCRSDATRQLRRHIETGEEFHQNIRDTLMCASMRSVGRADFNFMWNRLISLPLDHSDRANIIDWLGCSTSRHLLSELIRSTLNSTNSNNIEYGEYEQLAVLNSVIRRGEIGLSIGLSFLVENALEAYETFGPYFVYNLSYIIRSADHIESYLLLQNILLDAGLLVQEDIDFNMEIIADSIRWLEIEGVVVNNWLSQNV
ncbi:Aminopeptidase N [Pseudolycoriella hygida]|uniref:Aminopeptidase n=1 Tax=Pseudolycoriella hygida TaxID=35572 RepID=A0A9Q0MLF7_9DIPT|nr:Aminopeptidase N [Pseudolycoriella hygida]